MQVTLPHKWRPREYQFDAWEAMETGTKRAALVWHRRAGKDLFAINFAATKAFERVGLYWHILPTYNQGRKVVWEGRTRDGRAFLDHFPGSGNIGENQPIVRKRDDQMSLWFRNGSVYQVVGAEEPDRLVGSNPIGIIFSEWSVMPPRVWEYLRPILAENGGWVIFIYTPRGRNHGYRTFKMAQETKGWFSQKLTVEDTEAVTQEAIEDERAAGMPEELVQQEFYCFGGDTLIYTERGQRRISDIRVGDLVLSHACRWRKVNKVYEREYEGSMLEIKSYGEFKRPLVCTPNHPVRVLNPAEQTYQWVAAFEVKSGDFMVMPRLKTGPPVISEDLAALIGWYIAEGSCARTAVQFSFHIKETEFRDEVIRLAKAYGADANAYEAPENNAVNVVVNSVRLADLLALHCGSGSHSKRIPHSLITGHEQIVFDRLMAGDGCEAETRGIQFQSYTTVSHDLARDVQLLASGLGMRAGISHRPASQNYLRGRLIRGGPSYSVQIHKANLSPRKCDRIRPSKHGVGVRVKSVEEVIGPGRVYNLAVQYDHSYVAEGRVVHNCSFDAPLVGAYYGDLMATMMEDGRIGVIPHEPECPVTTAWDLGIADYTSIWFHQLVGHEHRLIDYYQSSGVGLDHYAKMLSEKPYTYKEHLVPHDATVRELGTGKSRIESARKLGVNMRVVPKLPIADGISATRFLLPKVWADENKCSIGIEGLRQYTKERILDEEGAEGEAIFRDKPLHNWASHPADALRTLAVGLREFRKHRENLYPDLAIV